MSQPGEKGEESSSSFSVLSFSNTLTEVQAGWDRWRKEEREFGTEGREGGREENSTKVLGVFIRPVSPVRQ